MNDFIFFENLNSKNPLSTLWRNPHDIETHYENPLDDSLIPFSVNCYLMKKRHELIDNYNPSLKDCRWFSRKNQKKQRFFLKEINNACQKLWYPIMADSVEEACRFKFTNDTIAKNFLLSTNNKWLVNTNFFDPIWAIGRPITHGENKNPKLWRGNNLLGQILMNIRAELNGLPTKEYTYDKVTNYNNFLP